MGKLTKARRAILEAARDHGTAFAIYNGRRAISRAGGATKRCIDRLMREGLIDPMIGSRFGTLTQSGRAALSQQRG